MAQVRRYGVDTPDFPTIREEKRVYVDKTDLIYNMTHDFHYVFLSRPRRFGKTLLCSTLECYFEGRKELFEGLAIEKLEKEWKKYPVIYLDLSMAKYEDKDALENHLCSLLEDYESKYNIAPSTSDCNSRLLKIISKAYAQEQQKVVVIIDEYDTPLLNVLHKDEKLEELRQLMRRFYSPLKASFKYLHFVFLTGISKFSQLSIFSEFNNLKNISMMPVYAAICGITEEELLTKMSPSIDAMAKKQGKTREETIKELKKQYDGYHFTWPSPDIYNPYSLVNAFSDLTIKSYWFETGTSTYLIEMMRKLKVLPSEISGIRAYADDFDAPSNQIENITPLLYQSGYITIKKYLDKSKRYILNIPNEEVRDGLMKTLLPYYVTPALKPETKNMIGDMSELIDADDMDGALAMLQKFLLKVPYPNFIKKESAEDAEEAKKRKFTEYEGYYQQLLYVIFSMLGGWRVSNEVGMATGNIDMTLETRTRIYVIEIKANKSAESALAQIDAKNYTAKYSLQPLPVYKLGLSFDTEARTIKDWILELA